MPERRRIAQFLASAALALLLALSLAEMIAIERAGRVHSNDFKHLYLGVEVLAAGGSPYDPALLFQAAHGHGIRAINPYVYLPATGLMLRPMIWLGFEPAVRCWMIFNWLLAWTCVLAGPAWMRLPRPALARWVGALYLAGALPFMRQMTAGQMNVAVLGALIFSLGFFVRGRDFWGGVVLGLAGAFKIAPLFMGLPLLLMRRPRGVGGLIAGFAAVNLAALAWAGWDVHMDAIPVIRAMGYGTSTWAEFGNDFYRDPFNQSFNSIFHHLFAENPYTQPWIALGADWANRLTMAVSFAMLAAFAVFALLRARLYSARRPWSENHTAQFHVATLLMLLLPSLMWDHYAVQTLGVMMWLAAGAGGLGLARGAALAVAFAVLAIPWVHHDQAYRAGAGILLMSLRLWGTLILLGLAWNEWNRAGKEPLQ